MNSNCLAGIRCPVCGQEEQFVIEVETVALVTDNGIVETYDTEWTDDSTIQCYNHDCEHVGKVREFRVLDVEKEEHVKREIYPDGSIVEIEPNAEIAELREQVKNLGRWVENLQAQKQDMLTRANALPRGQVRKEIIQLVLDMTGTSAEHELQDHDLTWLNQTLEALDLEPVQRKFKVVVEVRIRGEVEIEVEASSLDVVNAQVKYGDHDDEIRSAINLSELEFESSDVLREA